MKLTKKQDIVLRFMHQFYLDQDTLPPMQTMADVFEWASANTAYCMLQCLVKRGAVERNIIGKYRFTKPGKEYCAKRLTS